MEELQCNSKCRASVACHASVDVSREYLSHSPLANKTLVKADIGRNLVLLGSPGWLMTLSTLFALGPGPGGSPSAGPFSCARQL